jgi:predicted ATP-grasp superfamily ATP-dependent carboligase
MNGKKVKRSVLYSEDSISIAGVALKFIQDVPRMISKSMARDGPLSLLKYEETRTQTSHNNET